ncbi:MAG: (2Fe-2S)-binding protein [Acidobacteria bacterium]|nr:(2Fe-2S)-binding protein [Acidobacteriota bacterium]MCB9397489.1 (2Fe-2S)-binding protein [Acidobacteriota bacterium]
MPNPCRLMVNGEIWEGLVDPFETLLEVLRERLDLTGAKQGCSQGECGACTVLVDGNPVMACLMLALEAQNTQIETIESLATQELHPLQIAFVEKGAVQCGFCTPGMVLSAKALIDKNPHFQEQDVRAALAGNHCRCTGYTKIIDAVMSLSTGAKHG